MKTSFPLRITLISFSVPLSLACGLLGSPSAAPQAAPADSIEASGPAVCDYVTDQFVDISGPYLVEGGRSDQSGENYSGKAGITQISGNCFNIQWSIEGRARSGIVTMVGNIVSGNWSAGSETGTFSGVANTDGTITLSWGPTGGDETEYLEILTKQ